MRSAGANFECSDYFGGLQSQLLMRWDLVQHQRRIREDESDFDQSDPLKTKADDRPISMPQGLSLRAIPRGSEVDGRGAVKKHRLMLAGWCESPCAAGCCHSCAGILTSRATQRLWLGWARNGGGRLRISHRGWHRTMCMRVPRTLSSGTSSWRTRL